MKRTFAVLAASIVMLFGIQAFAQPKLEAGYLNSTIKYKVGGHTDSENGNGFTIGLKYGFPLQYENFVVEPGLMFDILSIDSESFTYFRVPIHLNYNYALAPDMDIFFGAGPGLVLGLGGSDDPYDGMYKRFNLQFGFEAGFRFSERWEIKVGYDWGLLNISDVDHMKIHQGLLHIGGAYCF